MGPQITLVDASRVHRTRGYRFELKVNNKERTRLYQCAGTARFAWNWGLAARNELYHNNQDNERFTDAMKQHKQLNALKRTDFPWMYHYSKCVPQEALRDLEQAFQHFYQNRKDRKTGKTTRYVGFPQFKKKGKCKDSFRLTGTIRVFPATKQVQLPRLGKLRLKERPQLPASAHILSATVSRTADRWYVALQIVEEVPDSLPNGQAMLLGLDPGLAKFATFSNGIQLQNPKWLRKGERKLRQLSQAVSRKLKGSKNRQKAVRRLARFHQRLSACRTDHHHKLSAYVTQNHGVVVTEDLYIAGLQRNKRQAKSWADVAHGEFRRQLIYKSEWHGTHYVEVPRFFPSSKLCSTCWYYHADLTLAERTFECPMCGMTLDRDLNAALNMEWYYHCHLHLHPDYAVAGSSSETLNACGEVVRPDGFRHTSMKQEISRNNDERAIDVYGC
ncbi:MAG: RNA-guided endonuclease InsQ/TnpB family protein [Candidatus Hodarchaeales archaeon]|jgi:putative transposase